QLMDFEDFLIEQYELTDEQKRLSDRLKAQANLRQLLNSLAAHALYFSRALAARGRQRDDDAKTRARQRAEDVWSWFASLDVAQRVSVLTCSDASWVRTALKMSRLQGSTSISEGYFRLVSKPTAAVAAPSRLSARDAAKVVLAPREPTVQYRRPHRLPNGDVLNPPATDKHRAACRDLVRGMRVCFKGCCASMAFDWGALVPAPGLVSDPQVLIDLLQEVSLGRFLRGGDPEEVLRGSLTWQETPWLRQWGSHFPLAAFLASRLEVQLLQGFASRLDSSIPTTPLLSLAEVWSSMPVAQQQRCIAKLGRGIFRRLLSETLAAIYGDGCQGEAWTPPEHLADLLSEVCPLSGSSHQANGLALQESLNLVWAVSTLSLPLATEVLEVKGSEVLQSAPKIWLHQQMAEELAIACSEYSASSLLEISLEESEEALARKNRGSKKQRQKLRRRKAGEEEAAQRMEKVAEDSPRQVAEDSPRSDVQDARPDQSENDQPETLHPTGTIPRISQEFAIPHGAGFGMVEEWDGQRSQSSSIGRATTMSSNTISDFGGPVGLARGGGHYSLLDRGHWGLGRPSRRWHDDSRLEFLLRNRDGLAPEVEWDRVSQGSVPASLDEAAFGLESRFAYLFDSPPRSHTTTALASQATVEDDADRLRSQWEDDDLVEWQKLQLALEKSELEREMWRTKAAELEGLLSLPRQSSGSDDASAMAEPGLAPERKRLTRLSAGSGSTTSLGAGSASGAPDDPPARRGWRYLSLMLLARRQINFQMEAIPQRRAETLPQLLTAIESPGQLEVPYLQEDPVAIEQLAEGRPPRAQTLKAGGLQQPGVRGGVRTRAMVTFGARMRGQFCDSATQTAPAITLSKMYGGIVPIFIQRELARLRQENQLMRYRIASLAMSQPLNRPRPVRHQATQTAPALTFSTARQQGSGPRLPPRAENSIPRLPPRAIKHLMEVGRVFDPAWLPGEYVQSLLEASIHAFVRAVEAQTESQALYRRAVVAACKRTAQQLWPRCSVELYGSCASGIDLPSSGLDLILKAHPTCFGRKDLEEVPDEQTVLSRIDEDVDQVRHGPLDEVSPGHSSAGHSMSSGWQQQLSARLAQEKWVLSDSIRITAHAAIPVLSFITTPEEAAPYINCGKK
ncbi:unnamed protein product, partial [Polarella glacialis]